MDFRETGDVDALPNTLSFSGKEQGEEIGEEKCLDSAVTVLSSLRSGR